MTLSLKVIYGGHPEPQEDVEARTLDVLAAHGPLLKRAVSNLVHGTDKIGAGSTYAALGTLRQRGLVTRLASQKYAITAAGHAALALSRELAKGKPC